jgi:hypothetical protein
MHNKHATIEELLEMMFSIWSHPRLFGKLLLTAAVNSCVEAGSNTSTVTLQVIGGDEKGSLEYETVKYGHESHGTRT